MKLKAYEYLFLVNKGFDEVTRNLRALARYPALRPVEIAQFAQLAEEARSTSQSPNLSIRGRAGDRDG